MQSVPIVQTGHEVLDVVISAAIAIWGANRGFTYFWPKKDTGNGKRVGDLHVESLDVKLKEVRDNVRHDVGNLINTVTLSMEKHSKEANGLLVEINKTLAVIADRLPR